MSGSATLFGSYGLRAGRAGIAKPGRAANDRARSRTFGRRQTPPVLDNNLQLARLDGLLAELQTLFADRAYPEDKLPFVIDAEPQTPQLLIGDDAVIMIDPESGLFTFQEKGPESGVLVVTASDERLLDHVICHLSAGTRFLAPHTAGMAVRTLVGQSVEDVERLLILQTLRHCQGNRTHAAKTLGISIRTIRNKLRNYWRRATQKPAID